MFGCTLVSEKIRNEAICEVRICCDPSIDCDSFVWLTDRESTNAIRETTFDDRMMILAGVRFFEYMTIFYVGMAISSFGVCCFGFFEDQDTK